MNADQITLSRALDSEPFPFQLPLQLGGTIQSRDQPSLNNLEELKFELTGSGALTIAAPQANPLAFRLKLPTTVQVRSLSYNPRNQLLSFSLIPKTQAIPTLKIIPPPDPLTIKLTNPAGLKLRQLSTATPINFTLITSEFDLPIQSPSLIRIKLSKPPTTDLFEQALKVKQVNFQEAIRSDFSDLPTPRATLLGGQLTLGNQEPLTLQRDQFLTFQSPGISELSFIRIQSAKASDASSSSAAKTDLATFDIGVVGETTKIAAGLSSKHPIAIRQTSVLSGIMSANQLAAVNGFLGGIASSLVLMFFKD